jgi:predicted DsbA family dithiol-disulfide isomerase
MDAQIPAIMNGSGPLIFFYDYVDPASFILELLLRERGFVPGSNLTPLPLELNPPPGPLRDPDHGEWKDHWDRTMERAREIGLKLTRPWIVPWTRKAHELVFFAGERGWPGAIHEALFRAYLVEGQDIGRVDVLVQLGREQGLDGMEAKAALDVDKYGEALKTIRSRAILEGFDGPGTLQLDGRLLHGSPTPEELDAFLATGAHGRET